MMRIFEDLGQVLAALLPPWAIPIALGALAVAVVPPWLESVKGKQIKGAIRRLIRAEATERPSLRERALALAGRSRGRLIGLVQEAMRYGQRDLIEEGLRRLEAHPKGRGDAKALRQRIEKPPPVIRNPLEATVRIERLLDEGLVVAAEEQLELALKRFPNDPDLLVLRERV